MKYLLVVASTLLLVFNVAHAEGLRRLKKDDGDEIVTVDENEAKQLDTLSLHDEYAPSFSPTAAASDVPSQVPTVAPSKGAVTTTSPFPSEPPSALPIIYETYSGKVASGKTFRIEIKFDYKPQQNAWHLFKGLGSSKKEIYAKDFGSLQSGGMHVTTFENMEAGEYTFVIADIKADGITGGKLAIYIKDDVLLWERDGAFGFLVENAFLIQ